MREEFLQLIDELDKPIGLGYFKGIPTCDMSQEELNILCTYLIQEYYKKEKP